MTGGTGKDMAETRRVLGPKETLGRLLRFTAIGVTAVAVVIVAVVLLNTDLSADPNTRTFLLFLSFAAALVLVATIGASLVFLWGSFLGQYIQRLALLDDIVDERRCSRQRARK